MNTRKKFEEAVYDKPPRAEREIPNYCFWILDEVVHTSVEGYACIVFAYAWHIEFLDTILNALAIRYAGDGKGLELIVLESNDRPSIAGCSSGHEWKICPHALRHCKWMREWAANNPHHLARGAALTGIYYGTWNGITSACPNLEVFRILKRGV